LLSQVVLLVVQTEVVAAVLVDVELAQVCQ